MKSDTSNSILDTLLRW